MVISESVPSFSLNQDRSFNGIPSVSITFPDGYTDTMKLSRYYSNENDRLAQTERCHFFGHLEGEPEACIALTGCPGSDDLEFTIMSEHSPDTMFMWNKNGEVQIIESQARGTYLRRDQEYQNGTWANVEEDEMVNPAIKKAESEIEKNCDDVGCEPLPETMLLSLRFGYDEGFLSRLWLHARAKEYIHATMPHIQALYCHSSLGTKIQLEIVGEIKHYAGKYLQATPAKIAEMKPITKADLGDADLMVYMGNDWKNRGFAGYAYYSAVCLPRDEIKSSIIEYGTSIADRGHLIAHEIGHNLGMFHDHDPQHKVKGCDKTGVMSYGPRKYKWSTCSKSDFQAHYIYAKGKNAELGKNELWCMPRKCSMILIENFNLLNFSPIKSCT